MHSLLRISIMTAIILFFTIHWFLSLFFHSFFLHRYASHQMYTAKPGWEKTFYFLTWFVQGSSFLVPRAYAVMHRMHHAYSDTEKDPHSPHFFKDIWHMMMHTARIFSGFVPGKCCTSIFLLTVEHRKHRIFLRQHMKTFN